MRNLKLEISNSPQRTPFVWRFELWFLVFSFQLLILFGLCGCVVMDTFEFMAPEGDPWDNHMFDGYQEIKLKESSATDVLAAIYIPEYELLSQSKSVIASQGEKKRSHKMWFNMVAFDENKMTVQRKYLFIEDERPKFLFNEPWEGFRFHCEMVMDKEVFDQPYANENARRIAVLKQVLENFRGDVEEVERDNKMLKNCGMMVNQALETVIIKLDVRPETPALAIRLDEKKGVEFDHINLDKGRIGMLIECDEFVTVKMMLGSFVRYFESDDFPEHDCEQEYEPPPPPPPPPLPPPPPPLVIEPPPAEEPNEPCRVWPWNKPEPNELPKKICGPNEPCRVWPWNKPAAKEPNEPPKKICGPNEPCRDWPWNKPKSDKDNK
jgi:hypothetical protein